MRLSFFEPSIGEHAPTLLASVRDAVVSRGDEANFATGEPVPVGDGITWRQVTIDWAHRRASQGREWRTAHGEAAAWGADVFCDLYLDRSIDVTPPLRPRVATAFVAHRLGVLLHRRRRRRGELRARYARLHLRRLAARGAGFVVHSSIAAELLAGVVAAERIQVAGIPIRVPDYLDRLPGPTGIDVVCPGAARPDRGTGTLVRALASVPSIETCELGRVDPASRADLGIESDRRIRAADAYLDERAYWAQLARAALVVLPYRRDYAEDGNASLVLVEALAAGKPLVVTEAVAHLLPAEYPAAVVVTPDDPEALAAGLVEAVARLGELTDAARVAGPTAAARDHSPVGYLEAIVAAATR